MRRAFQGALAALVVVLGIGAAVYGPGFVADAEIGVGYVAKHLCSCLHVARRPLDACRADLPPAMSRIGFLPLPGGAVASVLWIERTALVDAGGGCTLR